MAFEEDMDRATELERALAEFEARLTRDFMRGCTTLRPGGMLNVYGPPTGWSERRLWDLHPWLRREALQRILELEFRRRDEARDGVRFPRYGQTEIWSPDEYCRPKTLIGLADAFEAEERHVDGWTCPAVEKFLEDEELSHEPRTDIRPWMEWDAPEYEPLPWECFEYLKLPSGIWMRRRVRDLGCDVPDVHDDFDDRAVLLEGTYLAEFLVRSGRAPRWRRYRETKPPNLTFRTTAESERDTAEMEWLAAELREAERRETAAREAEAELAAELAVTPAAETPEPIAAEPLAEATEAIAGPVAEPIEVAPQAADAPPVAVPVAAESHWERNNRAVAELLDSGLSLNKIHKRVCPNLRRENFLRLPCVLNRPPDHPTRKENRTKTRVRTGVRVHDGIPARTDEPQDEAEQAELADAGERALREELAAAPEPTRERVERLLTEAGPEHCDMLYREFGRDLEEGKPIRVETAEKALQALLAPEREAKADEMRRRNGRPREASGLERSSSR